MMSGFRVPVQPVAPDSSNLQCFFDMNNIVVTKSKVPFFKRESFEQSIMGNCAKLLCFFSVCKDSRNVLFELFAS